MFYFFFPLGWLFRDVNRPNLFERAAAELPRELVVRVLDFGLGVRRDLGLNLLLHEIVERGASLLRFELGHRLVHLLVDRVALGVIPAGQVLAFHLHELDVDVLPGVRVVQRAAVPGRDDRGAVRGRGGAGRCQAAAEVHLRGPPGRYLRKDTMKASELRAKDVAALEKEVTDLLKAHFGLRMQKATQQLTNHSQLGKTRRDIARAKTVLAEKKKEATK